MNLSVTNVHLDLGAGRRGTDMGPSAMHVAGLLPKLRQLGHTISNIHSIGSQSYEALDTGDPQARFLPFIKNICAKLSNHVKANMDNNNFPLVLGGDHSQAIGTISGIMRHYKALEQEIGVIWVDAHTDMNTPTSSPSGNIHGMPLANLLGRGHPDLLQINEGCVLNPKKVVLIGIRDVDSREIPLVKELGVRVYTMSEIDQRGSAACFKEAIEIVSQDTVGIHLSFDLDGVDPRDAPGVGTPVPGGLTFRESQLLCEMICRTQKLIAMEMVELNPTLDISNQTAKFAVWLIQTALGKTIL